MNTQQLQIEALTAQLENANREREALRAKLDCNRCNAGHKTLPLALWDCPACHDETRAQLAAAKHQIAERERQVARLQDTLTDARNARDRASKELDRASELLNRTATECADALRERDNARRELAALKSAPVRFEREVDAELRAALKACCEWTRPGTRILHALDRWLAAPLSAPDGEKAAPAIEESTFDSKAVAPAPADGERVKVHLLQYAHGAIGQFVRGQDAVLLAGERILALDARVVREGGGK